MEILCFSFSDLLNIVEFGLILTFLWIPLRVMDLFKVKYVLFSRMVPLSARTRKRHGVKNAPRLLIVVADTL